MTKNYCVLVLGMHRSGTSALTRHVLDKGFSIGSETLPPHPEDNPDGYWESPEIVRLNNKFLEEIGSCWRDVKPFPSHCFSSAIATRYQSAINKQLQSIFRHENQIVIKDPRMCRLVPLWLPVLKDYCHHISVVFIIRQAKAVFHSLAMRLQSEDIAGGAIADWQHAFSLWLRYNLEAEFASRGLKRLILSYEQWLEFPVKETKRIHYFLCKSLPGAVVNLATPTLYVRRHKIANSVSTPDDLEQFSQKTYAALFGKHRDGFLDKLRDNANARVSNGASKRPSDL